MVRAVGPAVSPAFLQQSCSLAVLECHGEGLTLQFVVHTQQGQVQVGAEGVAGITRQAQQVAR